LAFLTGHFAFHFGLCLSPLLFCLLARRTRRLGLAALPLLAIALSPLWPGPVHPEALAAPDASLRVMSLNLEAGNRDAEAVLAAVAEADPDLLLLQEYAPFWRDVLRPALADRYPHRVEQVRSDSFGMAWYSRLGPLAERGFALGTWDVPAASLVLEVGGQTLKVLHLHLLPPRSLDHFCEMRRQMGVLLELVDAEPGPLVLAGDFNFDGSSAYARALGRAGFADAWDLAGSGRGDTWPDGIGWAPGLRLDHVFLRAVACHGAVRGRPTGSDHLPVVADLHLP
jgi:endonuclease/exonuclease/phosphatase (EEP) superfamily protein YafD